MQQTLVTAWAIASYIDEIAARGKAVRDIFMYTNVWMDRNSMHGWNLAGLEYPWRRVISQMSGHGCGMYVINLDALCPDIYEMNPDTVRKAYDIYDGKEKGWPLYVPESGLTSVNAACMFSAVGEHKAVGYHVFGIESCLDESGELKPPLSRDLTFLCHAEGGIGAVV